MAATAIDVKGEERDGHKIILKLSKHVAAAPNPTLNESQPGGDETRRVEPLRIQLSSDVGVAKPQDASDADASSCSSSCAEDEVATSLAQLPRTTPHIVPKLTIRAANEERVGSVVPKLTIKLPENPAASGSNSGSGPGSAAAAMPSKNDAHLSSLSPASASSSSASSSSSSSSSSSLAEMQTVPKLMIKTTLAGSSCISSSSSEEHPHPQQQQIPKLTIKTGGGGGSSGGGQEAQQQHLHTVIMKHDLSNAQSIPKLTIKTKSIDLTEDDASGKPLEQLQPLPKLTIKNLCSPKHKVRAVLEEKVPSTASKLATPVPAATPAPAIITNGMESNSSSQEFCGFSDLDADQALAAAEEGRRNSDDMDIDESLSKEHDPQMFHNLAPSNGIATGKASSKAGKPNPAQLPPVQHNVVEMVDLTSSPSPGSSPAHVTNNFSGRISPAQSRPANLIDCLRMKAGEGVGASSSPNSTILLSQLTAPPKSFATASPKSNSSRYPQLTERLLANGGGAVPGAVEAVATSEDDAIGAPIEILDTPEGSPHITYMEDEHLDSQVLNNHHPANRKDQQPEDDLQEVDNNNENHLKRSSSAGNESPSSGVSIPRNLPIRRH